MDRLIAEKDYGIRIHGAGGILFAHLLAPLNGNDVSRPAAYSVRDDNPEYDAAGKPERKYVSAPGRQYPYTVPYLSSQKYKGFCDPSGGRNDSMVLAIAHEEKDRAILDLVREVRAPFSPQEAVKEFCQVLKAYCVSEVIGDRYSAEWVKEAFERQGITYIASDRNRSEIYLEFLPALTSGQIELLDNDRMKNQFAALERRTGMAREKVDHPFGGADDVANACAGAVVLALSSRQDVLGVVEWFKGVASGKYPDPNQAIFRKSTDPAPQAGACPQCHATCVTRISGRWHCKSCALDFGILPKVTQPGRTHEILDK